MRRKPAILLFLLVLLLSIGGAIFHHRLSKEKSPSFAELDTFLRQVPAAGEWELYHKTFPDGKSSRAGWWEWLGIRRHDLYQEDIYEFNHLLNKDIIQVYITRENGRVFEVIISSVRNTRSGSDASFRESIHRKFPQLWHYNGIEGESAD
jgi:hypothetical protein